MTVERSLCVVIHDVAPATWDACRRILDVLSKEGVDSKLTWLAVPRYHGLPRNAGFERWLTGRADLGDEVVLHGFDHLDHGTPRGLVDRVRRRLYTRGEAEFWDLDFDAATGRLQEGRRWLRELGIVPDGFIAPAWLLGQHAWRALREQPFSYTCTLRGIHLLHDRTRIAGSSLQCQAQVWSSATPWRQRLSVLWNATLARQQRDAPIVRLELHPSDDVPVVRRSWERLLRTQAATRGLRTLGEVAADLRKATVPRTP